MNNSIQREVTFLQPRAAVWAALTTREMLAEWIYPNDFEPRVGHRFTFQVPPNPKLNFAGLTVHCEVLECDPPREGTGNDGGRLVFSWTVGGPVVDTRVSFQLLRDGTGTRLLFEHAGFDLAQPYADQAFYGAGFGWAKMLGQLSQLANRMDRYTPAHDVTPKFLEQVKRWIDRSGEVLVMLRYLRAAGAKDYALCNTYEEFLSIVRLVPLGTDIEVFRDRQLPIRGVVDQQFIDRALVQIPESSEFLVIKIETNPDSRISRYGYFDVYKEMQNELLELQGVDVALGVLPDFLAPDNDGLISASKGGIDGPR